jgi:ankyrin repeat protein
MSSAAFDLIKALCRDRESSESQLISQLESTLRTTNPEVLNEKDRYDRTLLYYAVMKRSVEFIKVLVETNGGLQSVKTADRSGRLPIHIACVHCNVKVVKYLLSIYPESINIANKYGHYPVHNVIWNRVRADDRDIGDLIRFLLLHDQGVVSKPTTTRDNLALHVVCMRQLSLEIVKVVYNTYPQAIHRRNNYGHTPLDVCDDDHTKTFLEAQLEWERQAHEQTQTDEKGQLPIHRFLHENQNVHVGTVRLMIHANPNSATARDNTGFNPLHYACKFGHVDVVKFLLDSNQEYLKEVNFSGDLPLHIACLEGKCSVINCILKSSDYGISLRNKDDKLPLELLLLCEHDVNRDSLEYIEAVNRLLRAHPNVLGCLAANDGDLDGEGISREVSSCALKRKHGSI